MFNLLHHTTKIFGVENILRKGYRKILKTIMYTYLPTIIIFINENSQ